MQASQCLYADRFTAAIARISVDSRIMLSALAILCFFPHFSSKGYQQ